ncbi:type II toxin-antitoxin system RatA family toxin [Kingella negevensis]|uniref:Persistence and stress-resistance toxin PasT n=1 Tax=Kingella negevensis TaxID=1522312 RepID=A0A238HFT3_9NEIS|nr:type II toxin-antitoxin system RatA family toxin [Kingella negevensis]MDK4680328.1 type II toxin-antitoxin system RatA family toxin [Kingella negevensis]MDK4681951.1 type II toxin-antitoxin system RatA family toxin [Kingella negevensis]MDK4684788.1 type II toxin-antitoxin system RatA family toxin [Kingella negevensis]MDK4690147.1 type II toxin-antitoxin system RatA family toxin [Kingella negevensis]MDK4692507.1 type II toxin-antitoxin system RatA family toxin [Kingella negevensis]
MSETTIRKTVLTPHSAEQMFNLVDRAEDYPQFLPWYGRTEILYRSETELKARLHMDYMGITQSFATHNHNEPNRKIRMDLLEGPFKTLYGTWIFTPLGDDICQIDFELHYELTGILTRLIAPAFSTVTNKLVDAFVKEAKKRYG